MLLNWAMRPCGRWILWYTVTVDPWVYLVLGWAPCGALSAPKKAAALSATIAPGWWQRASSLAVAFLRRSSSSLAWSFVLAGIIVPVWNAFWALRKFSPC